MNSSRPVCLVSTPQKNPFEEIHRFPVRLPVLGPPAPVLSSVGGSSHPSPPNRHSASARAIIASSSIIVNRTHRARFGSRAFASPSLALASPRLAQPHVLANHSNLSLRIDASVSSDPFVVLAQSLASDRFRRSRAHRASIAAAPISRARARRDFPTSVDSQSRSRFAFRSRGRPVARGLVVARRSRRARRALARGARSLAVRARSPNTAARAARRNRNSAIACRAETLAVDESRRSVERVFERPRTDSHTDRRRRGAARGVGRASARRRPRERVERRASARGSTRDRAGRVRARARRRRRGDATPRGGIATKGRRTDTCGDSNARRGFARDRGRARERTRVGRERRRR